MRHPCQGLSLVATFFFLVMGGCDRDGTKPSTQGVKPASKGEASQLVRAQGGHAARPGVKPSRVYSAVDRDTFNRLAVRTNLPIFWREDANSNRAVDPGEVAPLLFYGATEPWVSQGRFTPDFDEAYELILSVLRTDPVEVAKRWSAEEARRRGLVQQDLDQGKPTLVWNDLSSRSGEDRQLVRRMLRVASLIDDLFAAQLGISGLGARIPADDPASRSLVRRNWGPRCKGPLSEKEPACTAVQGMTEAPPLSIYPADLQGQRGFCKTLQAHPRADALMDPFVVVDKAGDDLVAIPYTKAYSGLVIAIAEELETAARELRDPKNASLVVYMNAAARAFRTGDWPAADEAWVKMNATNSRWYLRVGPDETYWEPCSRKAGFHLTLALINPHSLGWQRRISPVRQDMEDALAKLIGAPYKARGVSFQLPDFIDIVLNAGNSRHPLGAVIGQSLPNWGPVANEGRGRTVAMSNLYIDVDSGRVRREQAESLLAPGSLEHYPDSPDYSLLSTILHEASHNLGPAHEYRVNGKKDGDVFGGPMATVLEELKAQTVGLWLVEFLRKRGIITDAMARKTYTDAFLWAMGHISRGMVSPEGEPRPYGQLAAIQVGFLMQAKAVTFLPEAQAANKKDMGSFTLDLEAFPAAMETLTAQVGAIKARGDRVAAEGLVARFVTSDLVPQKIITRRLLRHPRASFVYGLAL